MLIEAGGGFSISDLDTPSNLGTVQSELRVEGEGEGSGGEISEDEELINEYEQTYSEITPPAVEVANAMLQENISEVAEKAEGNFPRGGESVDTSDLNNRVQAKIKALDKMLVAKAAEEGIEIPPLSDRIAIEKEKKKKSSDLIFKKSKCKRSREVKKFKYVLGRCR